MENQIVTIQNVRGYCDETGTAWLNAADVARGLGFTQTQNKSGKEYTSIRWERVNQHLAEFGFPQKVGEDSFIPENMFYRLVWKSRDEKALAFQAFVADEILPTLRKTGSYSIKPKQHTPATDAAIDARLLADEIQNWRPGVQRGIALSKAVDVVEKAHNLSLQVLKEFLPPAKHETGYLNPTQISERLGGIPPQTVNKMLAAKGMEYKRGNIWRLTEEGKAYGEEIPYTRNGHSGYQIRWSEEILSVLTD